MTEAKTVRITCIGADEMPLKDIIGLQGDLKSLSKENYARMKHSILAHGFAFPLAIATIEGKPHGVIDGHQRHRVLEQMAKEGFTVPEAIPVVFTEVQDAQEAAKLILAAVSQYGKLEDDGLSEFVAKYDIPMDDLPLYDFPDFDMNAFYDGYGNGDGEGGGEPPSPPAELKCPKCGHKGEKKEFKGD